MKCKIDCQDSGHGCHLGFPIGIILATFDVQVTPMLNFYQVSSQLDFKFRRRSAERDFQDSAMVAVLDF